MNLLFPLRRAAQLFPGRIASRHGDWSITWRNYLIRAHQSAAFLRESGFNRIAILMQNCPEYLELYHAALLAHIWVVPLNTRWSAADVIFTVNDSEADTIILDAGFLHMLPQLKASCPDLRYFVSAGDATAPEGLIAYRSGVDSANPLDQVSEPHEHEVTGLFYTSGTTGGPKGAILTHGNLYANAVHAAIGSDSKDASVYLHAAPMFHLADYGATHFITMFGATHCYLRGFDLDVMQQTIERFRVTSVVLVPTMITMLLNHPSFSRYDLSSLRRISYGASPMPAPLLSEAREKLRCDFVQGYGMTETSPVITSLSADDHKLRPEKLPTVGRPVVGCEVRIVDDQDGDVPRGQVGEIIARGANRMTGYWKRPAVNAEVLRGGWMHTGDMGAMDEEGYVTLHDRKKDMIKPGGENVYSPEVESLIMAHPAVLEAAVIGVSDPKWTEAIRAIVVLRSGQQLTEAELIAWCRDRLTRFKCPASVIFIDALPKGGTAKVQKNVLRERFGAR